MFKVFLSTIGLSLFIVVSSHAKSVDPTAPLKRQGEQLTGPEGGVTGQQQQPLVLEAIIHGVKVHTVVINNQELQVGDRIGEYRLVAVNDDSAVLRSADERIKLYMFSGVKVK